MADVEAMETEDLNASYGMDRNAMDTKEIPGTLGREIQVKDKNISKGFTCIRATALVNLNVKISVVEVKHVSAVIPKCLLKGHPKGMLNKTSFPMYNLFQSMLVD